VISRSGPTIKPIPPLAWALSFSRRSNHPKMFRWIWGRWQRPCRRDEDDGQVPCPNHVWRTQAAGRGSRRDTAGLIISGLTNGVHRPLRAGRRHCQTSSLMPASDTWSSLRIRNGRAAFQKLPGSRASRSQPWSKEDRSTCRPMPRPTMKSDSSRSMPRSWISCERRAFLFERTVDALRVPNAIPCENCAGTARMLKRPSALGELHPRPGLGRAGSSPSPGRLPGSLNRVPISRATERERCSAGGQGVTKRNVNRL
jgi:hypothetical protein